MKGLCELLCIRRLMGELGFDRQGAIKLYCDNPSAIKIAENLVQHDRSMHVEIDSNFVYEKLKEKSC